MPEPHKEETGSRCPVCASREVETFFEIPELPTLSNVLLKTAEAARQWPTASIRLGFCGDCGWIGNTAFDPGLLHYDKHYENSLHYSAVFQNYAERLARYLFRRFHLTEKDLIEIGCGQGDFLHMLCRLGRNRGVGFDPSFVPDRARPNGQHDVRFVREHYSSCHAGYPCDFLCCRHVLEHIADPASFLKGIRKALDGSRQANLYFEVPNALFTLRGTGIWDPIYEHHSYFTRSALKRLFASSGFRVLRMRERFGQQFLGLEASLAPSGQTSAITHRRSRIGRLPGDVRAFATSYRRLREKRRHFLRAANRSGRKVVLWGAGSKAVNFLNVFREERAVDFVVDLNRFKQGMFIPGTGQQIVAPEFLTSYRPDVVVVMNPIYRREIVSRLHDLGLDTKVLLA
ncbi:MAG TPA: methyltransferase domain-containing protein [Patescibacteria group bacterium]|nr:methyltransferase domain-containing protein [Patescibacteria group bacterium]